MFKTEYLHKQEMKTLWVWKSTKYEKYEKTLTVISSKVDSRKFTTQVFPCVWNIYSMDFLVSSESC